LPQAPTRYSPFGSSPENAKARQKEVLRRMAEDGYISDQERLQAEAEPLNFATAKIDIQAPHFVFYVKDLLVEKYGLRTVEQGGLRVTTSLDLDLQTYAQASLSAQTDKLKGLRIGNGAALITQPDTGEILSMVGSRNYFDTDHDGNVNVTLSYRQPGSSIKPLNYASALDKHIITPATLLLDIPTCFIVAGQPEYCPQNYDSAFHGPVQVRFALGNSYNLPAVKVLGLNTIEDFTASASAYGITGWDDPSRFGLSLTLGGGEVRLVDMAVAFGALANAGIKVPLHPILKVEDYQGNVLEQYTPAPPDDTNRVLSTEAAYLISHILLDNNARTGAFGPSSQLIIPNQVVSVKTGTTNDLRDNWTIGYTPKFLTAAWVGNNDNTPMSYLTSGVTGAAPIWNILMRRVLKDEKPIWPEKPESVVATEICSLSGLLPNPDRPCDTRNEFFIQGTQPQAIDNSYRGIWIDKTTNLPATTGDNLELREHLVLSDSFTQDFCVSCPWPQLLNPDGTPLATGSAYPEQTIDMENF
jgi:membrane peptidoglycan carboxypeptidase